MNDQRPTTHDPRLRTLVAYWQNSTLPKPIYAVVNGLTGTIEDWSRSKREMQKLLQPDAKRYLVRLSVEAFSQ